MGIEKTAADALKRCLQRIIKIADSQYEDTAPASSDLCDEISAIAHDALAAARRTT